MVHTVSRLLELMRDHGAVRFYAKKLSPNDNSKNQVYLGGDFSALNIIPYSEIRVDGSNAAGSKRDRAKAAVRFFWIDTDGVYLAPGTQLILYPKYPEVRMSGFLSGCANAPGDVMRSRDEGRVLLLGVTNDGQVLGHAAGADSSLAREIYDRDDRAVTGVFVEIPADPEADIDTKERLIAALKGIHARGWIPSQKLSSNGLKLPYRAPNGGGYTLEAELGVSPNGYALPDFLGWEIKQYGVTDFVTFRPKSPVTLMTPEPTGGIYRELGVIPFLSRFGYPDQGGIVDRVNFGGVYRCNADLHPKTGLRLTMVGYDFEARKITDMNGGLVLLSHCDEIAAAWNFAGIMQHWNRKHAQAAYVPSMFQTPPPEYAYGSIVLLGEQTDFGLFLDAVATGIIYYDPGIKMERASSVSPLIKRRSQFRIPHNSLIGLYHSHQTVDLLSTGALPTSHRG